MAHASMRASRSLVVALAGLAALAAVLGIALIQIRTPVSRVALKEGELAEPSHAKPKLPLSQGLKAIEGTFAKGLWKTMKSEVPKIRSADAAPAQAKAVRNDNMPSMSQVLHERKEEAKVHTKEEVNYHKLQAAPLHECGGMSVSECSLGLDATQLEHLIAKQKHARKSQLHEVDNSADSELRALQKQEALAAAKNKEEKKLNAILRENQRLAAENAKLQTSSQHARSSDKSGAHPQQHARTRQLADPLQKHQAAAHSVKHATQQQQQQQGAKPQKQALQLPVNEATQGNPPGVKEHVPLTVQAPPPGVPDFNGDTAVVARIPHLGFGPSILDEQGVEQRGSFTVRKANPYGGIWFRVYGKMNHPIHCTLRGYRKLQDEFQGNTVYTGYKQEWNAKTSISTGIIPPGPPDNFDILTCRDTLTGEVQHFRTFPDPSPGFFEDPRDDYFHDEYTT